MSNALSLLIFEKLSFFLLESFKNGNSLTLGENFCARWALVPLDLLLSYLGFHLLLEFAYLQVLRDLTFGGASKSLLLKLSILELILALCFELRFNLQDLPHILLDVVFVIIHCLCLIFWGHRRLSNVDSGCDLLEPLHLPLVLGTPEPPLQLLLSLDHLHVLLNVTQHSLVMLEIEVRLPFWVTLEEGAC